MIIRLLKKKLESNIIAAKIVRVRNNHIYIKAPRTLTVAYSFVDLLSISKIGAK